MFEIVLLPPDQLGPDGQRLGQITIGDFTERFACHAVECTVDHLADDWRDALTQLVAGASCVALIQDPRFAWLVYRDFDSCFVQQKLSLDGAFDVNARRQTVSDDGDRISEWPISLQEISEFLASN